MSLITFIEIIRAIKQNFNTKKIVENFLLKLRRENGYRLKDWHLKENHFTRRIKKYFQSYKKLYHFHLNGEWKRFPKYIENKET